MTTKQVSHFYSYGLTASFNPGLGPPPVDHHHHNEFELLYMARGKALHEHGGRAFPLPLRRLVVLWGGIAHRTSEQCRGTEIWAVHIPVNQFLGWGLPRETFVQPLLRGGVFFDSDPANAPADADAMRRWHGDINAPADTDPAIPVLRRSALLCELQARLLRFVLSGNNSVNKGAIPGGGTPGVVDRMLQYIAEHYQDPALDVAAIARHAKVHPSYANDTFRKACGASLMRYVTQQRVTHAQCLLALGGAKIIDIALDSGFGSASRFYQVFRAATGVTPRDYVRDHKVPPAHGFSNPSNV